MGNCVDRGLKKEIISKKSLKAVQELAIYMKSNVHRIQAIRGPDHLLLVQQIVYELERGGKRLKYIVDENNISECTTALETFLTRLKKPVIPYHIQALALDENHGISPEIVAHDILGLLKQDLSGRHATLIGVLLDLLNFALKNSNSDELAGYAVPLTMMPVLFNMKINHIAGWRKIASVFVEVIITAPSYFQIPPLEENFVFSDLDNIRQLDYYLQQMLLTTLSERYAEHIRRPNYRPITVDVSSDDDLKRHGRGDEGDPPVTMTVLVHT